MKIPALATIPASGFRAARRSPSRTTRTRCAAPRWPPSSTAASAAACAARTPMPRCCVPRSTGPKSFRTPTGWTNSSRGCVERQFTKEIESLRLGEGEPFPGEGIPAVTKALLQSGVSYVGGYQGAPVSHLLDVMVQARDYMDELGVHVESCTTEALAAVVPGAPIKRPPPPPG